MVLVVKNLPANAGDVRDAGLIPGSGRCPGGGRGNPLQYSCLESSMDRGTWRAIVHRVTQNQTWLASSDAHMHSTRIDGSFVNYVSDNWFVNMLKIVLCKCLLEFLKCKSWQVCFIPLLINYYTTKLRKYFSYGICLFWYGIHVVWRN